MKFISWNVNGLRACVQKGFTEYFEKEDADFSAFRRQNFRKARLILHQKDIIATGIMR